MTEERREIFKQKARNFAKNATDVLKQNPGLWEEIANYQRYRMLITCFEMEKKRES